MANKYQPGTPIKGLDELVEQQFIYCHGKLIHKGWFLSWQLRMTLRAIQKGDLKTAIKVNDEEG